MCFALLCCAPHQSVLRTASPQGEATKRLTIFFRKATFDKQLENKLRPSSPCFARSFPPRGSLWKRLTIFAEFCVEQNEARGSLTQGRLHIFAEENFATKNFQQARGSLFKGFIFPEILKFPQIPVKRRENSWQTPFFLLKSSLWVCAKGISMPFTPIFAVCFHVFLCGIRKKPLLHLRFL